ncbi:MAG: ribonucleoside-diphosphate reductase subunit alpha [Gammaproteobacteria bacterium]
MDNPSVAEANYVSNPADAANSEASFLNSLAAGHSLKVIRRDGKIANYDDGKIAVAITKAFLATEGNKAADSTRIHDTVANITQRITQTFNKRMPDGGTLHIEYIQDQVELELMRAGLHKVARAYVLYREERRKAREAEQALSAQQAAEVKIRVTLENGELVPLDTHYLKQILASACADLQYVSQDQILQESIQNLYDTVPMKNVHTALVMSARTYIEKEPNYTYVTARLLLNELREEGLLFLNMPHRVTQQEMANCYPECLKLFLNKGIEKELIDPRLKEFDLIKLGKALVAERDLQFTYLGLQTLYDRYFIQSEGTRFELPQVFFMRVAMGLALNEPEKEKWAIEFYNILSTFDFMSSTPTLFNSGTLRPQLSSCYLTTVPDDLAGIYDAIKDNALLQKYAGGLGNDWTPVRALGASIKGTNGKSQGVVPFLKVANDTAVAVNQGGKRKGALCSYLESWHLDILEFLELRKNTGDERRRTHDMNTANWVPDLLMKRIDQNANWTLFTPDEVPDLHDLYGEAFEQAYVAYENAAAQGKIKNYKTIAAVDLWRKMLGLLFETGHPWVTFKDACNLRSPQQHVGVIHSSNLCTEITLNTSIDEIAVCNLGSINLVRHVSAQGLDEVKLEKTIKLAVRMLDNVVDVNFYSVPQAKNSNMRHRPVGMGLMGFQDALYIQGFSYTSDAAVEFADRSMETISYYAIKASTDLAEERGPYSTFAGSLWSKGILPIDSIQLLEANRGAKYLQQDRSMTKDWNTLRKRVMQVGMRNSNVMAIAPTATISNICGVSQSIEPTYQNLYVKSNLSGEFTVINPYLVEELRAHNLWDDVMVNDLKYFDGSLQQIDRIPADIKERYATAFEIDALWLVEAGSRRQKWIDQAQSLNLYMAKPSGKKLDTLYRTAWLRGLKTTYYLRSMGATGTEKSTVSQGVLNAVKNEPTVLSTAKVCSILDPDCEACQ